ncbi:MAG: hydrogenase maturation protein HypF [Frankiales bacterium]|nr:hydrogenase maturation protein HypF [Frankiales bacterium]
MIAPVRLRVHVTGLVQGVGFRPFVWRRATALGLTGWVGNDASGVVLEAEGPPDDVAALVEQLRGPPPLAHVDDVSAVPLQPVGGEGFEVRTSDAEGARWALVAPDTATCADCLAELHDPHDRRYRYPFLNCTNCGPRYTIVESVPYDRSRTTMAAFEMCPDCRREYEDPADRRFHAEPVACPACGPRLTGLDVDAAAARLLAGDVLAVKGLGGFHLAADATNEGAVSTLRSRKHREDRPFALMVKDVDAARALCLVGAEERALLTSPARPIVLMPRRGGSGIAPSVAPGSPLLGVMLPYTPLHHLLLDACQVPLVMTSGNVSDEPIAFLDGDAQTRLSGLASGWLGHDRVIRTRVDDSVAKVVAGRPVPIRRSRGYVPSPLVLPVPAPQPVLACGAALKNTFCIARGGLAFVSHHIGDLDNYATWQSYVEGIGYLTRLLDVEPRVVSHDLHPDYPSTRYALERDGVELIGVQHHHAHIASCLADNGRSGPVIGVAFDGLGMGLDGTAWGGEFLVADLTGFTREVHLEPVPMPGGDLAARQPWRMALAHLERAFDGAVPAGLDVREHRSGTWEQVRSAMRAGVNAPLTSSAGRLFDAVSALLGVRDEVTYEGQAAIELEHLADPAETGSYDVPVEGGVAAVSVLVRAVTEDLLAGVDRTWIAARFHHALADLVAAVCGRLRDEHGLTAVALSGGVFQNSVLLAGCLDRLQRKDFDVLTHRRVPCNDGGVSLGQAAVAAAQLTARG